MGNARIQIFHWRVGSCEKRLLISVIDGGVLQNLFLLLTGLSIISLENSRFLFFGIQFQK